MNNPVFRARADTTAFADRNGDIVLGTIYEEGQLLRLMDCGFTAKGFGVFQTGGGTVAWIHKDSITYVSGNLGIQARDTPIT